MQQRHLTIAWLLTAVLTIWAVVAGNVDAVPNWTIAIPGVATGFWWAFGQSVLASSKDRDIDA